MLVSVCPCTALADSFEKTAGWSWRCEAGCEESGLGLGGRDSRQDMLTMHGSLLRFVKPNPATMREVKTLIQDFILGHNYQFLEKKVFHT